METQLQQFIAHIKEEGVGEARKEADRIISEAQTQAQRIVTDARAEADRIIARGKAEAETFRAAAEAALAQAARNTIISLRAEIIALFDRVVKEQASAALDPKTMRDLIVRIVEQWAKARQDGPAALEVLLNESDRAAMEDMLKHALGAKLRAGVELKGAARAQKGFFIGEKGGVVRYDVTDAGIASTLQEYLNPRLRAILDTAVKPGV
jgi:V/A-type H+-transporting ATPase subunit E